MSFRVLSTNAVCAYAWFIVSIGVPVDERKGTYKRSVVRNRSEKRTYASGKEKQDFHRNVFKILKV